MDIQLPNVFRIAFYLWAGWELAFLANLYRYAYYEMKQSKVIGALTLLFSALALLFLFLSFVAFSNAFDQKLYSMLREGIAIPVGFVAFSANRFRKRSLERTAEKLKEDLRASK